MIDAAISWSISEVLEASAARLKAVGIETCRLDARILMAHVLKCEQAWLLGHGEELFPRHILASYNNILARRVCYEPVAYLTGVKEFWSLPFKVTRDTLIPRPDSEILVETAVKTVSEDARNVIDLGTGTGCLLLSLLNELPFLQGLGLDCSSAALTVANENAAALHLSERARFRIGRWDDAISLSDGARFELVVSNPPYIPNSEIPSLAPDIRCYEPRVALKGGLDGLEAYRQIACILPSLLAPRGLFIGEFGLGQGLAVGDIFYGVGLRVEGFRADAAGRQRCIIVRKET